LVVAVQLEDQVQEEQTAAIQLLEHLLLCQQSVAVVAVELAVETDQETLEVQVVVVENVDLEQVLQVDVEHAVKEIQEDLTMLQDPVVAVVKEQLEQQHQDQAVVVEQVEQV
jgi:hypothetical protein